ncbi:GldM family protein [Hymenobacter properus]|uniref:Gliding motility-associated protein GldM C-terminal domain-containing protein n=1 Tax=Hymenobacter properus TaxID=2791026 RepID=A0A931FNS9_9BACT|nr:GldM family protein [Hymenobacter properus]MBF9142949.1 hypothetical protein [Hymenobacter properus]MBR7721756.1 hypothetical protein [Microvirga sp. SRT04]
MTEVLYPSGAARKRISADFQPASPQEPLAQGSGPESRAAFWRLFITHYGRAGSVFALLLSGPFHYSMRARFLLPALWLLSLLLLAAHVQAQNCPLRGPWRVIYQPRIMHTRNWDNATDTVITLNNDVELIPARWNASPDSIQLFARCENQLIAPAAPRSGQSAIRFVSTGATSRLDASKRRFIIVPFAPEVTLWAYKGRALLFKHEFKVVSPPAPTISCTLNNGNDVCSCYGTAPLHTYTKPNEQYSLTVRAVPDPYLETMMFDDAQYRLKGYSVTLMRNGTPLEPAQVCNTPTINLSLFQSIVAPGDQLLVEVHQAQRKNFKGQIEDLALEGTKIISIPVPVSYEAPEGQGW